MLTDVVDLNTAQKYITGEEAELAEEQGANYVKNGLAEEIKRGK